jgi:hypothetical protein
VLEGYFVWLRPLYHLFHFCPTGNEKQLSSHLPGLADTVRSPRCQNCWLPAQRNQLSNGSSVLESSFYWWPNRGLPKVPGSLKRVDLIN